MLDKIETKTDFRKLDTFLLVVVMRIKRTRKKYFLIQLRTISHPGNSGIPPVWCSVPSTRSCKILAACDNNLYLLDYPDQFTLQHPSG